MKIYTSVASGKRLKDVDKYGLGFMIPSTPDRMPGEECKERVCALDNGAYISWRRGYPFMESIFMKTMEKCYKLGVNLEFMVIPDIVGGGMKSLDFSCSWLDRLSGAKLALAVQDGMTDRFLDLYFEISRVTTIFVGGTNDWKWETLPMWKKYADKHGKNLHVGRCGTLDNLTRARELGVDSVDSSSFIRNESWHIIDDYYNKTISRCPSCGVDPIVNKNGMFYCETKDCMMMGSFTRSAWEGHCKTGDML